MATKSGPTFDRSARPFGARQLLRPLFGSLGYGYSSLGTFCMSQAAPTRENTCGFVVSYNPGDGLVERVAAQARQVDRIFVVDNASQSRGSEMLGRLAANAAFEVQKNARNLGVAAALNQGAEWARAHGYCWLLAADQDTQFGEDALACLRSVWQSYPEPQRIAVIGCNFVDSNLLVPQYEISAGDPPWSEQKTVITAGSLISLEAFREIGPFREELFIDHVDHEYCLRARRKGFKVLATRQPLMRHAVGSARRQRARRFVTYNHPPARWYYMLRNEMVLAREYLLHDPAWVFMTIRCRVRSAFLMLCFEDQRLAKTRYALSGLSDGLRGRFGRALL